jgi:hypothetical protein
MQSAWCALLQDIELMPQYQDFGFQPPLRLAAVAQHTDEKEGNCNHATIMLYSLLTASQGDGVFGSDRPSTRPRLAVCPSARKAAWILGAP